jgi:arylsulfatase A-like enzyme
MFMRWPGHVLKGSVSQRFVMNVDVAPTILDAAGINPPHNPDGRSLLFGSQRDRILTEYFRDPTSSPGVPTWASTRTKSWQFTQYYDGDGEVTFEEYYNLKKDPYQLTNLMADGDPENDPDLTEERQTLDADRNCEGSGCP